MGHHIIVQRQEEQEEKQSRSRQKIQQHFNMISKMNISVLVVLVVASLMTLCEAKPRCGLRWRGPCRRSFKRGVQNDAYDAFVAEKVASELEESNTNDMKDEDLVANLETELLDIIKKSKAIKRFTE